jgi:hypothetical protein
VQLCGKCACLQQQQRSSQAKGGAVAATDDDEDAATDGDGRGTGHRVSAADTATEDEVRECELVGGKAAALEGMTIPVV